MQSEPEEWQETFGTNITGQFFLTAALLPLLERGRNLVPGYTSSVVNVSSISGVMKGTSSGQFAYATSKAGLIHLTRMVCDSEVLIAYAVPALEPPKISYTLHASFYLTSNSERLPDLGNTDSEIVSRWRLLSLRLKFV